jgi:hypothetical protein
MTIDDYIARRNQIQLKAEAIDKETADRCWAELGVANRHIQRVLGGQLPLRIVSDEIEKCFRRVTKEFGFNAEA